MALDQMVSIIGGDFTSRINMNLREDKHWSYGAGGLVLGSKEERPFIVYTSVQTDKTAESVTEIRKEISEFVTTRPATDEEVQKVKEGMDVGLSSDLMAIDIRQALYHLGEITGQVTTDDLLGNIFSISALL